jgi:hypothetical protein
VSSLPDEFMFSARCALESENAQRAVKKWKRPMPARARRGADADRYRRIRDVKNEGTKPISLSRHQKRKNEPKFIAAAMQNSAIP